MSEYELYNEKTTQFIGSYPSDKMLEKCDVITFKDENYFVSDLIIPSDRKLRVAVWPAKIHIPGDIEDLRLLHWIQQNLIGLEIRLSNDKNSVKGKVIDYWPNKRLMPPDYFRSGEMTDPFYAVEYPSRMEILTLRTDGPEFIDLIDFSTIEILGNQENAL